MDRFWPKQVYIEKEALKYPLGKHLEDKFTALEIPIKSTTANNRVTGLPGKTAREKYIHAKLAVVVGVRRTLKFASCKPSAHYQLPLVSSCPGLCEYCYLQTTLGPRPIIRMYVNVEEILERAAHYIDDRAPEVTIFEGAATSDPIPVEHLTGSLKTAIEFFGESDLARFRFVTKYDDVDSILSAKHNGNTEVRFSLNTESVISQYEKATSRAQERLNAARKVAEAGFMVGFLIAPIILYEGWKKDYSELLESLAEQLPKNSNPKFELITHRFTKRAKKNILDVFPQTNLPLNEDERTFKFGQFGYGKYVYSKEDMVEVKSFFENLISQNFPASEIAYLV